MTQIYFHCPSKGRASQQRRVATVSDLAEARDHATRIVQSVPWSAGWRPFKLSILTVIY
jgi:hypothetical protein